MEREVAKVAAACDLRAFRYIPFPAVEFDPIPIAPEAEPEVKAAQAETAPLAESPPLVIPEPAMAPEPAVLAPPPPPVEHMPEVVPIRLVRPPAEPPHAVPPPASRRYRMLEELTPAPEPEPEPIAPSPRPAARSAPRPAMPALPGGAAARPPSPAPISPRPRGTTPRRAWPG